MYIQHLLSYFDAYILAFIVACVVGIAICAMTIVTVTSRGHPYFEWTVKGYYVLLGGVFSWAISYGDARDWEPWPPFLALIIMVDVILATRLFYRRCVLKDIEHELAEHIRLAKTG